MNLVVFKSVSMCAFVVRETLSNGSLEGELSEQFGAHNNAAFVFNVFDE